MTEYKSMYDFNKIKENVHSIMTFFQLCNFPELLLYLSHLHLSAGSHHNLKNETSAQLIYNTIIKLNF